jgi:hypothetical protein
MRRNLSTWRVGLALALCIGAIGARPASAELDGYGPFPVRNFQVIQLMFLGMQGDRAAVIKKGALDVRVELAETSSIFDETSPNISAKIKLEQLRSGVFLRYGLTDRLEVAMEIPAIYRYQGFMNGMISQVERLTSGLSPARASLKNTGFAYNLSRNGQTLFSGGDGQLGLGDITLYGKYQMVKEQAWIPAVSLRLAAKVPSGDEGRFFGSGHADFGAGVALEKKVVDRVILYGNFNGMLPTGPVSGLSVNPSISAIAAAEYLWTRAFSLVVQFDYYSSPFRNTGTDILDRGVTEIAVGYNYRLRPELIWQVYGIENLDFTRGSAADFTLSTLVTYQFGR